MRSAMLVALAGHGETIGVLTLVNSRSHRTFDEGDLAFAEEVARRAAAAAVSPAHAATTGIEGRGGADEEEEGVCPSAGSLIGATRAELSPAGQPSDGELLLRSTAIATAAAATAPPSSTAVRSLRRFGFGGGWRVSARSASCSDRAAPVMCSISRGSLDRLRRLLGAGAPVCAAAAHERVADLLAHLVVVEQPVHVRRDPFGDRHHSGSGSS